MAQPMERTLRQAASRSRATGAVIEAGACHDITRLPGGLDADLDEWEAGFTDATGSFLDRGQAACLAGHVGRLEARSFFAGEATPTLEAGHLESWRPIAA